MTERILAIDPGERVGWATGEIFEEAGAPRLRVLDHGISALKPFALKLHDARGDETKRAYDVIVYESFRIYPAAAKTLVGSDVPTAQLVGMIRLCGWLSPGTTIVSQGASIKSHAEASAPEWLKQTLAGLPKRHDEAHDGDALLHLWRFYFAHHFDPTAAAL